MNDQAKDTAVVLAESLAKLLEAMPGHVLAELRMGIMNSGIDCQTCKWFVLDESCKTQTRCCNPKSLKALPPNAGYIIAHPNWKPSVSCFNLRMLKMGYLDGRCGQDGKWYEPIESK
jgi:hypothetical protein